MEANRRDTLSRVCGRYASSRSPEDLIEEFEVDPVDGPQSPAGRTGPGEDPASAEPDWNVAPTKQAPVVLEREPAEAVDQPDQPQPADRRAVRRLRMLTWGLVPSWSKDRSGAARMINARAEGLLDKPAFRRAAASRRCLVPADGWYEWQRSTTATDAKGRPRKQPFFISPVAGGPIAFAGLYEFWREPQPGTAGLDDPDDPARWLTTFTIVTTAAEPGLEAIHDRMPLVLPRDRWDDWLDPQLRDPDSVRALLEPPVAGRFCPVAVTTRVNAVSNNGPELVEPAPVTDLHGVLDPVTGELTGSPDVPLF